MSDSERLQIDATPIQVCGGAIGRLSEFWDEVASITGHGHGEFIEKIFGQIWSDDDTGEEFEAQIDRWHEEPEDMQPFALLQAVFISCAYACQAMKAQKHEDTIKAWQYTARCKYWLGIVIGTWASNLDERQKVADFAMKGVAARHAENRAMKEEVFAYLNANPPKPRGMDGAATAIFEKKLVPIKSWRTARDWVGEWNKLRSTGIP
jgi:hypothetical protein